MSPEIFNEGMFCVLLKHVLLSLNINLKQCRQKLDTFFKFLYFADEDKLNLTELFKTKSVNRSKRRFSFKTRDDQSVKG